MHYAPYSSLATDLNNDILAILFTAIIIIYVEIKLFESDVDKHNMSEKDDDFKIKDIKVEEDETQYEGVRQKVVELIEDQYILYY